MSTFRLPKRAISCRRSRFTLGRSSVTYPQHSSASLIMPRFSRSFPRRHHISPTSSSSARSSSSVVPVLALEHNTQCTFGKMEVGARHCTTICIRNPGVCSCYRTKFGPIRTKLYKTRLFLHKSSSPQCRKNVDFVPQPHSADASVRRGRYQSIPSLVSGRSVGLQRRDSSCLHRHNYCFPILTHDHRAFFDELVRRRSGEG